MSKELRSVLQVCAVLVVLTLLLAGSGCAGGSKGTGAIDISGRVYNTSGVGLSGIKVGVAETEDFGITDISGNFSFTTEGSFADLTLDVQTAAFSDLVVVSNLPTNVSHLSLELEVDEEAEEVSSRNIDARDDSDENESDNHSENDDQSENESDNNSDNDSHHAGGVHATPRPSATAVSDNDASSDNSDNQVEDGDSDNSDEDISDNESENSDDSENHS